MECVKMCPTPDVSSPLLVSSSLYKIDYRRSASQDNEVDKDNVYFTQQQQTPITTPSFRTPSSLILPSTWKTPFTSRTSAWTMAYYHQSSAANSHFDILSYLPPEVSISIFHYLSPKDLCRVCLVCRNWYQLSQHPQLRRRRRKYIRSRRAHYALSKENYCNGTHTPARPTARHASSARQTEMTSTSSPLSTIQAKTCQRTTMTTISSSTPPSLSPASLLLETTTPAVLLDNVKKLSLDESTAEIRRCLFPEVAASSSPPPPPPPSSTTIAEKHSVRAMTYTPVKRDSESVVGRRSNKCRLRRL